MSSDRPASPSHMEDIRPVVGTGLAMLEVSAGIVAVPRPVSPSSSQGSWVMDPEDGGWDGLGSKKSSPPSPREGLRAHQGLDQHDKPASPDSPLVQSWARVSSSPVAAEYPASPPCSPGSVRSAGSGGPAGEGLVGLARDGIYFDAVGDENVPNVVPLEPLGEVEATPAFLDDIGEFKAGDSCPMDVDSASDVSESVDTPQVVQHRGDLTSSEELGSLPIGEGMDVAVQPGAEESTPICVDVETSISDKASSKQEEITHAHDIMAPQGTYSMSQETSSSPRVGVTDTAAANESTSGSIPPAEIPEVEERLEPSNGFDVDAHAASMGVSGTAVDEEYDGGHIDRLWKWTGIITAAKMGVIPIMVCAALAALSTQTSSDDRGDRSGAGGGGRGTGGGGGGGTRSSSRRSVGGGGSGSFPVCSVRGDRPLYGCLPMPYCVAPCVLMVA